MAGSGIWLDDATYAAQAGQLWAQQRVQDMQTQIQAGQDWANQQIAGVQQQVQSQLQQLQSSAAQALPTPQPTPTPGPTPTPTPTPTPAAAPTPTPTAAPTPTLGTAPLPSATPSPIQAAQDWASQQIANLTQAAQLPQESQPSALPSATAATGAAAVPPPTPSPTPAAAPTPTTVPPGPQPNQPGDLIDQTRQAATAAGINPELFARQIQQESHFDPNAQSPAGAQGIAQLMPATAKGLGVDPMHPDEALPAAAKLMRSYLDRYGGDWASALSAYNAGPGNVPQGGGVPNIRETQKYVSAILGDQRPTEGQAAASTGAGQAVNSPEAAQQAIAARTSQFQMGLSSGDAMAFCGPAAAIAFAQTYGRNPTVEEAKALAQQVGWNPAQGMAGPQSEVALLKGLGVDAHYSQGVDWAQVGRDAQGGNPVILDTPGHYYYVDGYRAQDGALHVGTSGTDLKGGAEWMTPQQIDAMPQSQGPARGAIFADHPLAQQDGLAQSVAQGVSAAGQAISQGVSNIPSLIGQGVSALGTALQPLSSAVQSGVQTIQQAVSSVGQQFGADLSGAAPTLGAAIQPLAQAVTQPLQTIGDVLQQNALVAQGIPSVGGQALSSLGTNLGLPAQAAVDQVQQAIASGLRPDLVGTALGNAVMQAPGAIGGALGGSALGNALGIGPPNPELNAPLFGQGQSALGAGLAAVQPAVASALGGTALGNALGISPMSALNAPLFGQNQSALQAGLAAAQPALAQALAPNGPIMTPLTNFAMGGPSGALNQALRTLGTALTGGATLNVADLLNAPYNARMAAAQQLENVPQGIPFVSGAAGLAGGLLGAPSVLDSIQTLTDLEQKYGGGLQPRPGGGFVYQEPDYTNITAEDQQALDKAQLAVGGIVGEPGNTGGLPAGQTPADALQAARQAVGELATRFPQMSPGSLAASGAGKVLAQLEADATANPAKYAQPVEGTVVSRAPVTGEGLLQRALGGLDQYPAEIAASIRDTSAALRAQGVPASDVAARMQRFLEQNPPESFGVGPPRPGAQPPAVGPVAPGVGAQLGAPSLGGITTEGQQLLQQVEAGGVPTAMTSDLRRIADENGVDITPQTTPNDVLEALRAQAEAAQVGARMTTTTPFQVGQPVVRPPSAAAPPVTPSAVAAAGGAPAAAPVAAPPGAPPPPAAGAPPAPPAAPPPGQTTPPPANPAARAQSWRDLFNLYYVGNLLSGGELAARVAWNATVAPAWNTGVGMAGDLATFNPSRLQAGPLGMVAAYHDLAANFLGTVRNELVRQYTSGTLGQAGPLARVALAPQAAIFALHGGLREAAAGGLTALELSRQGGQDATRLGLQGQAWIAHAWNYRQNPPADALAQARLIGDQATGNGQLGSWGQMIADNLERLERQGAAGTFIGDAIWPVMRLPWKLMTQAVEYSPLGAFGTVHDVLSGLGGQGPYAGATAADIVPAVFGRNLPGISPTTPFQAPVEPGVSPLGQRVQHNLFGIALTVAAALKGLDGTVTGAGPDDPELQRQLRASGWLPYSVRLGDHYYSYDRIPGAQLTLGLIGDYHDAVAFPSDVEVAQAQAGLGLGQVPMGAVPGGGGGRVDYTAMRLFSHVVDHMASLSGLSNLMDTFGALGIGGGEVGAGPINALATEAAGVAGGLVPLSGGLRTAALATDLAERRPLPEDLGQRFAQNLPLLRQGVPEALSPSGQPIANVQAGLGALLPVQRGQQIGADPVSQAFANAKATLSGAPPAIPLGAGREIVLSPEQQRRYEELKGTMLEQMVGPIAASGGLDAMPIGVQQQVLQRMESTADQVARAQMFGVLTPEQIARQSVIARGPAATTLVSGVPPAMAQNPLLTTQALANQQALRSALGLPTSQALLRQQLAG